VKSLRLRLILWFVLTFAVMALAFTALIHYTLESELRNKNWQQDYPDHPDWKLHGSFSEDEVQDISGELVESALLWSLPLALVAIASGYWLAWQSLRPIASVNRQLQAKNTANLGEPITLPEADNEFRELIKHLNDLLARLDASFAEMNHYAAKVAHELRTPLTIMRLKVEQAGNRSAPELADELEDELHRLTHVVDQSLLIARAEQGRLTAMRSVFNLTAAVREIVEDFQLLTAEQNRRLTLQPAGECWATADPRQVRQIIHTLLTNALKHGSGDLTVRVKHTLHYAVLLVANRVKPGADTESTLGLGLRVVAALLRLEPGMKFHRRHGSGYHVARLLVPAVEQPNSFTTGTAPAGEHKNILI